MKQLPNLLTLLRFILTIFFIQYLSQNGLSSAIVATSIFVFASLTDYYDGYIAKRYDCITNFGKIMDPIADKFLVLAAFYIFVQMAIIPHWMFFLIFIREILVTGWRLVAVTQGRVLAAEKAGKYKTVLQVIVISVILTFIIIRQTKLVSAWPTSIIYGWQWTIVILMWTTVAITVFSGLLFFWHNRKLIDV